MNTYVSLKNISKTYPNGFKALSDVNLDVKQGEFFFLLGPSGSGKSTLLRIIAGLETASEGMVIINDKDVTNYPPGHRNVAMVFQDIALYPNMSVEKNIEFGLKMEGMPLEEIHQRVREIANVLEIESLLKRRPAQLSGGQQQRVALARALVRRPSVLLLDEPLSNLDTNLRRSIRRELKRLHNLFNLTIIAVTHDQNEAMVLGQRTAIIDQGRILQIDTPRNIYYFPNSLKVARTIAPLPMNVFDVEVSNRDVIFQTESQNFSIQPVGNLPPSGTYRLGIHPEHVQLQPKSENSNTLIGSIIETEEILGGDTFVYFEFQKKAFLARSQQKYSFQPQESVNIQIDWKHANWFDPNTEQRFSREETIPEPILQPQRGESAPIEEETKIEEETERKEQFPKKKRFFDLDLTRISKWVVGFGLILIVLYAISPWKRHSNSGRVDVSITAQVTASSRQVLQNVCAEFNQSQSQINLTFQHVPTNYAEKLKLSVASKTAADLWIISEELVSEFLQRGVLLELPSNWAAPRISNISPSGLKEISFVGNKYYVMPTLFSPVLLFYNRKMFRDAGLPEPTLDWTWQDFQETAIKMTKDFDNDGTIDQYGYGFMSTPDQWLTWIWTNGGELYNPTLHTCELDKAETREVIAFLANLTAVHKAIPTPYQWSRFGIQPEQLFQSGRLAMFTGFFWHLKILKSDPNLDFGVTAIPKGKAGRVPYLTTIGVVIWNGTPNPHASLEVLDQVTNLQTQKQMADLGLLLPVNSETQQGLEISQQPELYQSIIVASQKGRSLYISKNWAQFWESFISPALDEMLEGKDVDAICLDTDKRADAFLQQNKYQYNEYKR